MTEVARVDLLVVDGEAADEISAGQTALVFLDRTPFYAESGGQVGDTGTLKRSSGEFRGRRHRQGWVEFSMRTSDRSEAGCTAQGRHRARRRRCGSPLNPWCSTTRPPILHACGASKQVLGDHVEQRGSLVAPDHLRFDFTHPRAVTADELAAIERLVNAEIRRNPDAEVSRHGVSTMPWKPAPWRLFGEKYGDKVSSASLR